MTLYIIVAMPPSVVIYVVPGLLPRFLLAFFGRWKAKRLQLGWFSHSKFIRGIHRSVHSRGANVGAVALPRVGAVATISISKHGR